MAFQGDIHEIPNQVSSFKTEKGSVYTYTLYGRTQRKKVSTTGEEERPINDMICFVPTREIALKDTPPEMTTYFGVTEDEFTDGILSIIGNPKLKTKIASRNGGQAIFVTSNLEIQKAVSPVLVVLNRDDNKVVTFLNVKAKPEIGLRPFDTRKYQVPNGWERSNHLGHKIVEIS
jgi:hypothetical protein